MKMYIQPLHYFPVLYEGDCLYDILARFHSGSGHITSRGTSTELFGYCPDLRPTITLPYRSELVPLWLGNTPYVSPQILRNHHTAWQYLQLSSRFNERNLQPITSATVKRGRRVQTCMRLTLQGNLEYLRYCPLCLMQDALQKTPYWRQLHQLYGVKYCPIHGIELQNSNVSISKRLMRFVPASNCLNSMSIEERININSTIPTFKYNPNGSNYIKLANTIDWLLKNGLRLGHGIKLAQKYNSAIGKASDVPISGSDLTELMVSFGKINFLKELFPSIHEKVLIQVKQHGLNALTPLGHALIVSAIGYDVF